MKTLPIISLSDLAQPSEREVKKLYDACYEHGFFYLINHGVPPAVVNQTISASRIFFELPEEIKLNYRQELQKVYPKNSRGYVPLYGEFLHQEVGFDPKEVFDFGIEKELCDRPFTGPTLVPDEGIAPGFASAHYRLQNEIMTKVVPKLLKGLALALGLQPNWFEKYFTDPVLIHRTIYYPAGFGRAGKHTDNGIFTVLIQEYFPEPSLKVHAKQEWIDAACMKNALVINLGDMLQLWTNGLFVSTPHEVIHTHSRSSRISIPFFVYPNIETIIEPLGTKEKISSQEVMLKNFASIWETYEGAGRAKELK
ncbi:2-oxoglutarate and iron-dependent oxygenase domain-containing protein [Oscillatoria sp. HE19RPO]|uniref:2-oxoglutarate and iron-dependent oxygenase domain-containing protein n=1 Tax=Oscillatoria sp. HE19RPO TaxID=2954806 RepID=UPI0020C30116|nr:2-oxoglutarate and iron-dependent oxygenase domain-containing protein [Oscillatoria sp. HE19RPO]